MLFFNSKATQNNKFTVLSKYLSFQMVNLSFQTVNLLFYVVLFIFIFLMLAPRRGALFFLFQQLFLTQLHLYNSNEPVFFLHLSFFLHVNSISPDLSLPTLPRSFKINRFWLVHPRKDRGK